MTSRTDRTANHLMAEGVRKIEEQRAMIRRCDEFLARIERDFRGTDLAAEIREFRKSLK